MGKAGGHQQPPKGQVVRSCANPKMWPLEGLKLQKKVWDFFGFQNLCVSLVSNTRTGISHVGESGNFEVEVVGV